MFPRPITKEDFKEIHQWWSVQGWPEIPVEALPTTGWIIEGYCAGWLYMANSSVAKPEWIVGNPQADKSIALPILIDHIGAQAKAAGYKLLFTSTKHEGLIKRFQDCGYTIEDTNVTHLLKVL